MSYHQYIFLIPLLPLVTFVLLGLFGRKYFNTSSGIIGTASLLLSTVLSLFTAYQYFFVDGKVNGVYQKIEAVKFTWLQFSPNLSIDMGIILDPISVMMIVVVSFVSLMVHVFSLGYMKGEKRFATYYAFLSLFTFSMLGLVLSSNIFQIYVFWELVGVSSFLLIGFYYDRPSAVAASKKAFIVTRFADLGFLIGILVLGFYGGTLDFGTVDIRAVAAIHWHNNRLIFGCVHAHLGPDPGVCRWRRQIGHVPAAHLAARCDGRPHTGVGPDPCGNNGGGGCVPGGAALPAVFNR
jgi:NADH-quinone oxidoreductase subunit L